MLGEFAYHAAIMAPEIATGAADFAAEAASGLLKKAGRHLASGMVDEFSSRAPAMGRGLVDAAASFVGQGVSQAASRSTDSVTAQLESALRAEQISLVSTQELNLLRELAAAAATGEDTAICLDKLRAFHQQSASNMRL